MLPPKKSATPTGSQLSPPTHLDEVLAARFEAMAKELRCIDIGGAEKADSLLEFVEGLRSSLKTYIATLENLPDREN